MLRKALIAFGAVYIILAILGIGLIFVGPQYAEGHMLFGIFHLDIVHDLVHLVSGLAALGVATTGSIYYARKYFQLFGLVYGLVAIIGFMQQHTVLGLFVVNNPDNFLHVGISVASLALGFLTKNVDDRGGASAPAAK